MVFVLVLLTVGILLAVDYVLRREEREVREVGKQKKSPIFLSPEKALMPIADGGQRMYHLSHSWVQNAEDKYVYVGFDDFISNIFSSEISMNDFPLVGTHVPQGAKIWDVGLDKHRVSQLSPISGEVVDINPACKMNMMLPSEDVKKSWVIKMKADNLEKEKNNLMKSSQAAIMNTALNDELFMSAQEGQYLNDGGQVDPAYIESMSEEDWQGLVKKFFPYQKEM